MLLFCVFVTAQNDSIVNTANDSLRIKQQYGLRLGGDLGKLIRSFVDDAYKGFEITGDYRLKTRLYIAGEIGIEEQTNVTDYLDITTNGSYLKAGIDYNLYQNWLDMDNMIYTGFRAGFSAFSHTRNAFTVYSTNPYWHPQFSSNTPVAFNDLTATWLEFIVGIKAAFFNNFYIGLHVQLKGLLTQTTPDNFQNSYIPGFNKTYDSSDVGVGYGYTLAYRIPFYKRNK